MTVFTETWDATYETLPPDTGEAASQGASRIRFFKKAVSERAQVDHSWAGDAEDGKHLQVTLPFRAAKPTLDATDGGLYTKEVATVTELFYEDDTGTEIQLTSGGIILGVAAGTKMLFQQTAAPAGWTKDTTHNNKALRVVTGAASSGGATAFTTVFGSGKVTGGTAPGTDSQGAHTHTAATGSAGSHSHTITIGNTALSIAQMPVHRHNTESKAGGLVVHASATDFNNSGSTWSSSGTFASVDAGIANTGSGSTHTHTGSSDTEAAHTHSISSDGAHTHTVASHTHSLSLDLQYVDLIIATKD